MLLSLRRAQRHVHCYQMVTPPLQVQRIPKPAASKLVQTQASSESGQHAAAAQKPSKLKLLQAMNHRGSFGAGFASVLKVNPTAFKLTGSKAGCGGPENGTHCRLLPLQRHS